MAGDSVVTAVALDTRVAETAPLCVNFVKQWLDRDLTQSEVLLAGSAVEYAFNGDQADYDPDKGPFKPGKHNDLTAEDGNVLNWVWAYLRSSVDGAKDPKTLIGSRIRKIQIASDAATNKAN